MPEDMLELADTPEEPAPAKPNEPVLEINEIQGNILVGFNKPHQCFLFLRITDPLVFRGWLAGVIDHVSTMAEVLAFNRLWKAMRKRRGGAKPALEVAWFNLGFTATGLNKLDIPVEKFADDAFKQGLNARSKVLGDPQSGPGSPAEWLVGGPGREPDVILLFAADCEEALRAEWRRLAGGWEKRGDVLQGGELLHVDWGQALPEGREHFGFVDGISQPGVRGLLSEDPTDFLTPRRNPHDPEQGLPGQDLIWPGEFVFGYGSQNSATNHEGPRPTQISKGPIEELETWARNGSYLVARRLRQHVEQLDRFLEETATKFGLDVSPLAAKLIGRWKSGAPLRLAPEADDPELGRNRCLNNHFVFGEQTGASVPPDAAEGTCGHERTDLDADVGSGCPLAAHIRKMNPRDDIGRFEPPASPSETRTRRILRRGIPFAGSSGEAVGLHFLAYQTSLVQQFEFLQEKWANASEGEFSVAMPNLAGLDPLIGRDPNRPEAPRPFRLHLPEHPDGLELQLPPWVTPEGGGYFFCPSIGSLGQLSIQPRSLLGVQEVG